MTQRAVKGNTVRVHYTGRLKDGTIFDSSRASHSPISETSASEPSGNDGPLEFVIGGGTVIPGFDNAVNGMHVGDKKLVEIPPEEAYGEYVQEFVKVVPRSQLNLDFDLKEGMFLELHTEAGRVIPITVTEVTETTVTLDANHPLAGQTLFFDIELASIA
ncbi:MAG: peptidylprolyl isomerase [Acidobacteria bacterium]|nr:peptidylprolyl isomerase [Acidobacteriota bacterium]